MSDGIYLDRIEDPTVIAWIGAALRDGSRLARDVAARLEQRGGRGVVLAPRGGPGTVDDHGRGISAAAADMLLDQTVFGGLDAGLLLVEDDLARLGDTVGSAPHFYLDDRVFWWSNLAAELGNRPSRFIRQGASGYPTIAYVLSGMTTDLLVSCTSSDVPDVSALCHAVDTVIVSVYDAESYAYVRINR